MQIRLSPREALKALGIGVLTSLLLSAIMVPAFKFGIAPLPNPPSLAFAQLLLGANVPLPVGLLFHVAYSLAILEKTLGPEHPNVAAGLENYAALLRKTARADEADRMETRAKAIRAKSE